MVYVQAGVVQASDILVFFPTYFVTNEFPSHKYSFLCRFFLLLSVTSVYSKVNHESQSVQDLRGFCPVSLQAVPIPV